jgi:hypothetical protein
VPQLAHTGRLEADHNGGYLKPSPSTPDQGICRVDM